MIACALGRGRIADNLLAKGAYPDFQEREEST